MVETHEHRHPEDEISPLGFIVGPLLLLLIVFMLVFYYFEGPWGRTDSGEESVDLEVDIDDPVY